MSLGQGCEPALAVFVQPFCDLRCFWCDGVKTPPECGAHIPWARQNPPLFTNQVLSVTHWRGTENQGSWGAMGAWDTAVSPVLGVLRQPICDLLGSSCGSMGTPPECSAHCDHNLHLCSLTGYSRPNTEGAPQTTGCGEAAGSVDRAVSPPWLFSGGHSVTCDAFGLFACRHPQNAMPLIPGHDDVHLFSLMYTLMLHTQPRGGPWCHLPGLWQACLILLPRWLCTCKCCFSAVIL